MHRELRRADVDRFQTQTGRRDGSYGRAAPTIRLDGEVLQRAGRLLREATDERAPDGVRRVALVRVVLEKYCPTSMVFDRTLPTTR